MLPNKFATFLLTFFFVQHLHHQNVFVQSTKTWFSRKKSHHRIFSFRTSRFSKIKFWCEILGKGPPKDSKSSDAMLKRNHPKLGGGFKYFLFSPRTLGKMIQFWRSYLSKGWFNRKLEKIWQLLTHHLVTPRPPLRRGGRRWGHWCRHCLPAPCVRMRRCLHRRSRHTRVFWKVSSDQLTSRVSCC